MDEHDALIQRRQNLSVSLDNFSAVDTINQLIFYLETVLLRGAPVFSTTSGQQHPCLFSLTIQDQMFPNEQPSPG